MPARRPITIGQTFGRLTIISRAPPKVDVHGQVFYRVNARCECGNLRTLNESALKSGNSTSCGCKQREYAASGTANLRHGMAGSPTHKSWQKMRARCENPNDVGWRLYGARGIRVCDRWQSFENFLADMGRRPEGTSLERIDGTRDYEPSNCRWATPAEQTRNTTRNRFVTVRGVRLCLMDATIALGLHRGSITQRANDKGISLQAAADHFAAKTAKT